MNIFNRFNHFQGITLIFLFAVVFSGQSSSASEKDSLKIVAFGNSTTAHRKGIEKVFSVRLHEMLSNAGIPNVVINSGVGSSHTGSIKDNDFAKVVHAMDRFDKAVLAHHADWVTINFGLNDAYQDKGINGPSRIPLDKYMANLSYFIDEIKKDNGRVMVLPPNPVGSKLERFRYERVKQYRKAARKVARKKNVHFIDSWKLFYGHTRKDPKGIDSLLPDAVHPNDEGHKLIAEALFKVISKHHKK